MGFIKNEFKELKLKRDHILNLISYDDVEDMFRENKTSLFVVGGAWSEEFQAVASLANSIAKELEIAKIDVFDTKFINVFKEEEDLRDCLTLENKLKYYFIVEHTGYKNPELVQDTLIAKMNVPTFFAIKDGKCLDYFTSEYIKGPKNTIVIKGETSNKTNEFTERFKTLALTLK